MSVVLANLDPGHWAAPFGMALNALVLHDAAGPRHLIASDGTLRHIRYSNGYADLGASRNQVVEAFLASSADWLWWIDSDMSFPPTILNALLEHADPSLRPVIGALYFGWGPTGAPPDTAPSDTWSPIGSAAGWFPMLYDLDHFAGHPAFHHRPDYPVDQLVRVGGTGSGCVVIHRTALYRVMAELGPSWYSQLPRSFPLNDDGPTTFGEDLSFCLRLAAVEIPIYVHTGIEAAHHKGPVVGTELVWKREAQAYSE
jgi:hypothetical protein